MVVRLRPSRGLRFIQRLRPAQKNRKVLRTHGTTVGRLQSRAFLRSAPPTRAHIIHLYHLTLSDIAIHVATSCTTGGDTSPFVGIVAKKEASTWRSELASAWVLACLGWGYVHAAKIDRYLAQVWAVSSQAKELILACGNVVGTFNLTSSTKQRYHGCPPPNKRGTDPAWMSAQKPDSAPSTLRAPACTHPIILLRRPSFAFLAE